MKEIRPITQSEAEEFLNLLCNVFDLDYARAHSIFFAEPLFDLRRKWALFDATRIVSILTTVPLEFGWGRAIGIAGVATARDRQGQGLARSLLDRVLIESEKVGEGAAMLFARDTRLYERTGFRVLDDVVRGPILGRREEEVPIGLDYEAVRQTYDDWANADANRLRRDELRWKYWRWNLRVCTPFHDGYLCFEAGVVRELVISTPASEWILPPETEWLGLGRLATKMGIQLASPTLELHLMGYRVPSPPEMFMTDQF